MTGPWLHRRRDDPSVRPAYCIDCSEAARDWVQWPCSAESLVKVAVEMDRYLRVMEDQ